MYYLTLEDLVPNALIELVENDISRVVSYPMVLEYGNSVIEELGKIGINAILLIYRDKTLQFEQEYKEVFDFFEFENVGYVKLKEHINTKYLRYLFRTRQSLEVLIAMNKSKKALGIGTKVKTKGMKTSNFKK